MKNKAFLAAVAALSLGSGMVGSRPATAAVAASTQVDAAKVVADLRRILAANYVLADVRPKLDAALTRGLAEGHYDVGDPNVLAERINADLSAVAHDKHLGMHFDPKQSAELAAQPAGAGADDAPPSPEEIREAVRLNHGITELKVLPGNIRYMNLTGFVWGGPRTAEAYDSAVRFLKDGEAVIIDLRGNGGGSPEAVQYLVSHFLKANQPIVTFYMGADKVDKLSSLASLPAGRLTGKPLYVLTSGMTASAAEEFTGHVAGFRLGEIVGENTAGAGFRNEYFPVAGGYVISVSVGRAVLASTGKDWEGVGIAPTTKIEVGKALDLAQAHALRQLASTATGDDKRVLEAQAAVIDAKINPVATALPLAGYAGTYGERVVAMETAGLTYQRRTGGPKVPMIAVGANEFSFNDDPVARVRFTTADGKATVLELIRSDGSKVEAQRTQ